MKRTLYLTIIILLCYTINVQAGWIDATWKDVGIDNSSFVGKTQDDLPDGTTAKQFKPSTAITLENNLTIQGKTKTLEDLNDITNLANWEAFEPQDDATWLADCDNLNENVLGTDGLGDSCGATLEAIYDGSRYIYYTSGINTIAYTTSFSACDTANETIKLASSALAVDGTIIKNISADCGTLRANTHYALCSCGDVDIDECGVQLRNYGSNPVGNCTSPVDLTASKTASGSIYYKLAKSFLIRYDTTGAFDSISSWAKKDLTSLLSVPDKLYRFSGNAGAIVGEYLYMYPDGTSGNYWIRYHLTESFTDDTAYDAYDQGTRVAISACGTPGTRFTVTNHGLGSIGTVAPFYISGTTNNAGACGLSEGETYWAYIHTSSKLVIGRNISGTAPVFTSTAYTTCDPGTDKITFATATDAVANRMFLNANNDCYSSDGLDSLIVQSTYYTCECNNVAGTCKVQDTDVGLINTDGSCATPLNLQGSYNGGGQIILTGVGEGVPILATPANSGYIRYPITGFRRIAEVGTNLYGLTFGPIDNNGNLYTSYTALKLDTTGTFDGTYTNTEPLFTTFNYSGLNPSNGYFGNVVVKNGVDFTPYTGDTVDKFLHLNTSATFNISALSLYDASTVNGAGRGYHGGWTDGTYAYYIPYGDGGSNYNGILLRRLIHTDFTDADDWVAFDLTNINADATGIWSVAESDTYDHHRVYMLVQESNTSTVDIALLEYNAFGQDFTNKNLFNFVRISSLGNSGVEGKGTSNLVAGNFLYVFGLGTAKGQGGTVYRFPIER